jgi:hypothetical protein
MSSTQQHPSEIEAGDRVQLRVGAGACLALVEAVLPPSEMRLRVPDVMPDGDLVVRWLDPQGAAWKVQGVGTADPADGTALSVHFVGPWQQDQMRASQRVSGNRHSLRAEMQAGSLAPGARLDLVCLDISASGCRVSGVGRSPEAGDIVRLCCIHPFEDERWIQARVMRVSQLPFRRFEVGFRFDVADAADRVWLAAWRDAWAYVSRDDETVAPAAPAAEPEAA